MSRAKMFVWCELVCDGCNDTACGRFVSGGRLPLRSMRQQAESYGWTFCGNDSFCRNCSEATKAPGELRALMAGGEA